MAPLRWGIAGCGRISSDYVNALQYLGSDKHLVTAVAARTEGSAEAFARKFGVEKYYSSYEELARDTNVDVVYIGTIHATHLAVCKVFIDARKPVICEKPLCCSVGDTQDLLAYAKQKDVFLMEAMWSRCNPAYVELQHRLSTKEVGEVVHVSVSFGVPIPFQEKKVFGKTDLTDGLVPAIGVYALNFVLLAMDEDEPMEIKSMGQLNQTGHETEVTLLMKFSGGRFATVLLSTNVILPNEAFIIGTKGTLKLEAPFWTPETLSGPSGDFRCPPGETDRTFNFPGSLGLKYEAEEVANCLEKDLKESPLVPHSLSLKLASLSEEIRRQVGVVQEFQ